MNYSDFERNWYIQQGFGDPLATRTEYINPYSGKPITSPTTFKTAPIKGYSQSIVFDPANPSLRSKFLGIQSRQVPVGVSPEARYLYQQATGGREPLTIGGGLQVGPKTIVAQGPQGVGTIQSILGNTSNIPTLQDPNQGRGELRIRRSR